MGENRRIQHSYEWWKPYINECQERGITYKDYCKEKGFNYSSFCNQIRRHNGNNQIEAFPVKVVNNNDVSIMINNTNVTSSIETIRKILGVKL